MQRATVDLPEPDSPTMPSVWPLRTSSETSSAARTSRRAPSQPPRRVGLRQVPGLPAPGRRLRRDARVRLERRHGADQHLRVLVRAGASAPRPSAPSSTSSPVRSTATRCAISATTPKSCVMNSTRHAMPFLQFNNQLQDLRLRGDVERGGRLVGDQQRRLERERHRDHDALALAAGELVRVRGERCARGPAARLRAGDRAPAALSALPKTRTV